MPPAQPGDSVSPLTPDGLDEAAGVLTRAFFDYPLWAWLLPDAGRRRELMPPYAVMTLRWGLLLDGAYVAGAPTRGVAVWVPPDPQPNVDPDGTRTGWRAWNEAAGDGVAGRMHAVAELQGRARAAAHDGPHWYLAWLGIEPAAQRSGLGGALLRDGLARADRGGLPCLLETEEERNVPYYERHGFAVTHQGVIPDGGPSFWTMLRTPR